MSLWDDSKRMAAYEKSAEAEYHIFEEVYPELTQNVEPVNLSYAMLTENLLPPENYREFLQKMSKNTPKTKLNEFLLDCLLTIVRQQDGILNKLLLIVQKSQKVEHIAGTITKKKEECLQRDFLHDPKAWLSEKRKMENEIKKLQKKVHHLDSENKHVNNAISRLISDVKCQAPHHKSSKWEHPESEQSSESERGASDQDNNDDELEATSNTTVTISTQTSSTDLLSTLNQSKSGTPQQTSLNLVKPFHGIPNSPTHDSLQFFASGSDSSNDPINGADSSIFAISARTSQREKKKKLHSTKSVESPAGPLSSGLSRIKKSPLHKSYTATCIESKKKKSTAPNDPIMPTARAKSALSNKNVKNLIKLFEGKE